MNPTTTREGQESVRDALRRAAENLRSHEPASAVPPAVWAALSAPPSRRAPRRLAWAGGGLAAATLAIAGIALLTVPPGSDDMRTRIAAPVGTAFLPVAGAERWPQLVRETREQGPAWVVPAELPRESLAAMGLPYDPMRADEPVRAELLVHPSGDVLAVRFVQ